MRSKKPYASKKDRTRPRKRSRSCPTCQRPRPGKSTRKHSAASTGQTTSVKLTDSKISANARGKVPDLGSVKRARPRVACGTGKGLIVPGPSQQERSPDL